MARFSIVIVFICFLFSAPAFSHDWYPHTCCSGNRDCAPLDDGRVRVTGQGYLIDNRLLVPQRNAQTSPDGRYHACWIFSTGALRCFFAPPFGL